jgi:hypothetical protein
MNSDCVLLVTLNDYLVPIIPAQSGLLRSYLIQNKPGYRLSPV